MIWTKWTIHGTDIDSGLGKVSVYTQSKDCVGLHVCGLYTSVRGHATSIRPGS